MIAKYNPERALALARNVLEIEALAVQSLLERIDSNFATAVQLLLSCRGKVITSGMGKSGYIARKLAATFTSTGTPAFFLHPADASHGDLGMIAQEDIVVTLSNSGETEELIDVSSFVKHIGARLIAITGCTQSSLAKLVDVHLNAHVDQEACPLNLAPTASTTAALALCDALAIAVFDARGFSAKDFARSHPAGALGRKLLTYVQDVMHRGEQVPQVSIEATVRDAIFEMTAKRLGMTAVVNAAGQVEGVFTDGDLKRTLEKYNDFTHLMVKEVMTAKPLIITPDRLAVEVLELMEHHQITQMLVVNDAGQLIGALNIHDLFRVKVI